MFKFQPVYFIALYESFHLNFVEPLPASCWKSCQVASVTSTEQVSICLPPSQTATDKQIAIITCSTCICTQFKGSGITCSSLMVLSGPATMCASQLVLFWLSLVSKEG